MDSSMLASVWSGPNLNHRVTIVARSLSCPRAKGIPLGKAGIHLEIKDGFVDSRFRGNDKLGYQLCSSSLDIKQK
jgi:hypothetical protein